MAKTGRNIDRTKTKTLETDGYSKRTGLVSARDSKFLQQARADGLLEQDDDYPLSNLQDVKVRHEQDRSSPPLDEAYFKSYKGMVRIADSEARITIYVLNLHKRDEEVEYELGENAPFTEFSSDQGFNDNLWVPAPAFYQGFVESSFGCSKFLAAVGEFVTPAAGLPPCNSSATRRGGEST